MSDYQEVNADADIDEVSLAFMFNNFSGVKVLSREEELATIILAQAGDTIAEEKLLRANIPFVASFVTKYRGQGVDTVDLYAEAMLGLLDGIRRFDVELGFKLLSYAKWWMMQRMHKYIADNGKVVRRDAQTVEDCLRINFFVKDYVAKFGEPPKRELIAEKMGLTVKRVEQVQGAEDSIYSLNSKRQADEESEWVDVLEDSKFQEMEDVIFELQRAEFVREEVDKLPERERYIINKRFGIGGGLGATLEELGVELGVTAERVRQLEARVFRKFEKLWKARGYDDLWLED